MEGGALGLTKHVLSANKFGLLNLLLDVTINEQHHQKNESVSLVNLFDSMAKSLDQFKNPLTNCVEVLQARDLYKKLFCALRC